MSTKKLDNIDRAKPSRKKGFTIIEVSLVLAITGLMLIGVLGTTYLSISSQRYNDSLRNFAEYMRSVYNEVLAPESIIGGKDDPVGSSSEKAILGKVLVFNGSDKVQSVTLIGNTDITNKTDHGFLWDITDVEQTKTAVFCGEVVNGVTRPSSVQTYTLLWEAELAQANNMPTGAKYKDKFEGTMIIARTPTSAAVHTAFAPDKVYDFTGDNCASSNASFQSDLRDQHDGHANLYKMDEPVGICVVSDNSRVHREVRIAADGRNASAVWLRADGEDNACRPE